jgi:hypothetical protein
MTVSSIETMLHSMAIDSKGNIFTGETIDGGRRVQKFVPRGRVADGDLDSDRGHPHDDPVPT